MTKKTKQSSYILLDFKTDYDKLPLLYEAMISRMGAISSDGRAADS